jgi:DUF4097 and DUF4098 domain-containing protein YvlB
METLKIDVGDKPQIRITSVGGDLRLTGREGAQLEAHAPVDGKLSVTKEGKVVLITCRSGCLVFLPAESRVQVETIGGDVRAIGLTADLTLGTVGGDCSLRRLGKATIDRIGGDLDARKLEGDFSLKSGGSDGIVTHVLGSVTIETLGGDFSLDRVEGNVEVNVGGDASVSLSPQKKGRASVTAGGDLVCRLPEDASAKIKVKAGGDMQLTGIEEAENGDAGRVLRIGKGEADIDLCAGGDLMLDAGEESFGDMTLDLGESIAASIESKMADLEARFGATDSGFSKFDSDRIGERVRRVVSRSMRQAARAQRRAEKRLDRAHKRKHVHFGPFGSPAREPASEEERMSILRMLEQGKINVDEAENLLKALEDKS